MQGLDAQSLSAVSDEILQAVDAAQNLDDLENVRINALGKKGRISLLMRELGGMDADARKTVGQALNLVKDAVATALESRKAVLAQASSQGRRHPVFGLWPVSARARLRHAVQNEGVRKIDDFTALYSVAIVEFNAQPDPFLNMNHPEDIAHAEAALISKMPI